MARSFLALIIALAGLTSCALIALDDLSATERTWLEVLALLFLGLGLLLAITGILTLLSRRAPFQTDERRFWIDLAARRARSRHYRHGHRHRHRSHPPRPGT